MTAALETAGIYRRLIAAHLRSQMQHKVSFVLRTLGAFAANLFDFAGIAVLFGRIPQLSGWSLPEVALLYGISSLCFATAELFGGALDNFDTVVVQGTFDRVLLRPLDALFQVLTEEFALRRFGRMAQGGLVLSIALTQLPISWTAGKVVFFAVSLVSGTALFFGILILGAAYCFWIVQGKEATHVVTYGGDFMSNYPMDIYGRWLRRFATFVLPIGFVSYYPSLYLLERSDPFGLPDWFRLMGPVAAFAVCMAAWCAWRGGVSQYQSTGS